MIIGYCIIAALFGKRGGLLYDKTKDGHNSWVRNAYHECKKDKIITPETAENRIAEVREQKFKSEFNFKI